MMSSRAQAAKHMREVLRMNDIKIKVKKSELEYCFKADNYDEFHRRFNQLADIMYQRFINELTMEQLKKATVHNIYGYIDTDMAYSNCKQKISSIYGVCCKDNTAMTKINKRFGIAKRGNSK